MKPTPFQAQNQPCFLWRRSHRHGAFTLIELLVVIAVMGVLLAMTVPAISGLSGGSSLSTGTRHVSNVMTLARAEAIAKHTVARFCIATTWPEDETQSYRKFSVWTWDNEAKDDVPEEDRWIMASRWETLPTGVVFDPNLVTYHKNAAYALKDATAVRGDLCLTQPSAAFTGQVANQPVEMQYFEFTPSGAARIERGTERNVVCFLVNGAPQGAGGGDVTYIRQENGVPKNWSQLNVDTLTGRVRIYRP